MPGPPPKHAAQRRRRNAAPAKKAVAKRARRMPDAPKGLSPAARAWWSRVWKSPLAGQWTDADVPQVQRLARIISAMSVDGAAQSKAAAQIRALEDALGVDLGAVREVMNHGLGLDTRLMAEARQLEDRLGLSPMARHRMAWEVTDDQAPGAVATPEAPAAAGRFLRALEGGRS